MPSDIFNFYDDITELTWRSGLDPNSESDRMEAVMRVFVGRPVPIRRLSGKEINHMGLRPYVKDGKIDFDRVNADRATKGLNQIELGVHVDDNS